MRQLLQLTIMGSVTRLILIAVLWILGSHSNPVCTTPECYKLADVYRKNMDDNVSPCNNFYNYVCNGWKIQNPRQVYHHRWDLEQSLEYRTAIQLSEYLSNSEESNVAEINQIKKLYKACLNLPYLEKYDSITLKNIMSAIGLWPMFFHSNQVQPDFTWAQIDQEYIKMTGESALFSFKLKADESKNHLILAEIKQLKSPYGMLFRDSGWRGSGGLDVHYKAFLRKVIQSVAPEDPQAFSRTIENDLADVINFRELLRVIIQRLTKSEPSFKFFSIKEFIVWYNNRPSPHANVYINWLELIKASFKNGRDAYGNMITDSTIIKSQDSYFLKLHELLATTSKRVIANHIHLYFAERHIKLTREMEQDLIESCGRPPIESGKIRYQNLRSLQCLHSANSMWLTMRKMYLYKFFPKSAKTNIENLVEESKRLLDEQIAESSWLTKATKEIARLKVKAITSEVGYPAWYHGNYRNKGKDSLEVDPIFAQAHFGRSQNRVYLSATYMQWPVYTLNVPYIINYGATIAVIGHELIHAFDEEGIKYDNHGNYNSKFFNQIHLKYREQLQCFEDQFAMYRSEELKKRNMHLVSNTQSTLNEDLADGMGLKIAYNGYQKRLRKENGKCPILPGFEKLGCDKLFFIAFGNTLCSDLTPTTESNVLLSDAHSLPQIRLNGAVANMKEFSNAFKCKANDPMQARRTCDLWK